MGDAEAGTVLVLWTVALVSLMVLAGMAIDLGNIAQTKQHTSDAARNAVLSSIVDLAIPSSSSPPTAQQREETAVEDAEQYMTNNYTGITTSDFDNCPDPGTFPPGVVPSNDVVPALSDGVSCIGFFDFNSNAPIDGYVGMAVATPPRTVSYTFGRAAGLSSQQVGSIAYSVLDQASSSYLLPFGLLVGTTPGLWCIKDNGGNQNNGGGQGNGGGKGNGGQAGGNDPCTGFTTGSGQFGTLHGPRYRIFPGFDNGVGQNGFLQTNVDLGIDHLLNVYSGSGPMICDFEGTANNCDEYNSQTPTPGYDSANAAVPSTGMTMNDLTPPLFTGGFTVGTCTLAVPRLAHPDGFTASSTCSADNPANGQATKPWLENGFGSSYDLNGVSIENYLTSYGLSLQGPGPGGTTQCSTLAPPLNPPIDAQLPVTGGYAWESFDTCLSGALQKLSSGGGPPNGDYVFTSNILATPRFGEVPTLAGLGDGKTGEAIEGFMDVYLDLAVPQGSSDNKVGALLSWVFPNSWVTTSPNSGSGLSGYDGGPYTVNLCSYTTGSGAPGNCN